MAVTVDVAKACVGVSVRGDGVRTLVGTVSVILTGRVSIVGRTVVDDIGVPGGKLQLAIPAMQITSQMICFVRHMQVILSIRRGHIVYLAPTGPGEHAISGLGTSK